MADLALRDQASLAALTEDVVKTSEIEGEQLNVEFVRSSIARRLGVDIGALAPVDRHIDGVVERWCSMPPARCRWCPALLADSECTSRHRLPTVWRLRPAASSPG